MYEKLPIELREKIYELLLDFTDGLAVPRYDKKYTNNTLTFPSTYLFSPSIVGRMVCNEVQQLFVRTTPVNFHGLLDGITIDALLDTRLPSGSLIRDLVRHLRVFVRYELSAATTPRAPVRLPIRHWSNLPITRRRVRQTWTPVSGRQSKSHMLGSGPRLMACAASPTQVARSGSTCAF